MQLCKLVVVLLVSLSLGIMEELKSEPLQSLEFIEDLSSVVGNISNELKTQLVDFCMRGNYYFLLPFKKILKNFG